jgi:hypothetical protein
MYWIQGKEEYHYEIICHTSYIHLIKEIFSEKWDLNHQGNFENDYRYKHAAPQNWW